MHPIGNSPLNDPRKLTNQKSEPFFNITPSTQKSNPFLLPEHKNHNQDLFSDKAEKGDNNLKSKTRKIETTENQEKIEKSDKMEKPEKSDKIEKFNFSISNSDDSSDIDQIDLFGNYGKIEEKIEKSDKIEKPDKPEKIGKTEKTDKLHLSKVNNAVTSKLSSRKTDFKKKEDKINSKPSDQSADRRFQIDSEIRPSFQSRTTTNASSSLNKANKTTSTDKKPTTRRKTTPGLGTKPKAKKDINLFPRWMP